MAAHGGEPSEVDAALGGLDEEIRSSWAVAHDPARQATARQEAVAYAVGLQRAVYVLTGRLVPASARPQPRRHGP